MCYGENNKEKVHTQKIFGMPHPVQPPYLRPQLDDPLFIEDEEPCAVDVARRAQVNSVDFTKPFRVFQRICLVREMSSSKMLTWAVGAWIVVLCMMRQCNVAEGASGEEAVIKAMLYEPMRYASAVDPHVGLSEPPIDRGRADFRWTILHPVVATEGGFKSEVGRGGDEQQLLFEGRSHEVLDEAVRLYKEEEEEEKEKKRGAVVYFYVWEEELLLEKWMWVVVMEGKASSCEALVKDGKRRKVGEEKEVRVAGGATVLPWEEFARGVHRSGPSSSSQILGRVSVMAVPPERSQIFTPEPSLTMPTQTVFHNKEWVRSGAIDLARHLRKWE